MSPDGPVFEDVDVEVEGAGERQSQVRQLNDHIQPQRPGLLFHLAVIQGDDHLVDIGNDPGISISVMLDLVAGSL